MNVLLVLFFSSYIHYCFGKGYKLYYNVTTEEYNSMPKLFEMDNFDKCLNIKKPKLYCYATIQLSASDTQFPSKAWKIIEEVISVPRTYRHDHLRHGICLPKTCPNVPSRLYKTGNGSDELWEAISECYSKKYEDMGLTGRVIKLHCQDGSVLYPVDNLDLIYAFFLGVFMLLVLMGTIYDVYQRYCSSDISDNHKISTFKKILIAFSPLTNWEKLRRINTSDEAVGLYPLQGAKVYNTFFIIFAHTILSMSVSPVYNEKFWEDSLLDVENMFASNGNPIIQTYAFISGFALSYALSIVFKKRKFTFNDMVFTLVYRYFRFVPMLLIIIGFTATWFKYLTVGPLWAHINQAEYINCRTNWWSNLLFINNIYKPEHMCVQQTWYLAVDMQLSVVGAIVMFLVMNNRRHANRIFASLTVIFLIISVGHNYYLDVDIVFRSYPEILYGCFSVYWQWAKVYIASHFAIPTYLHGLLCGYYFESIRKQNSLLITNKFLRILFIIVVWVVPIATILIAGEFHKEGYEHNRLHAALYQGLNRYVFACTIGTFLLAASTGVGGPMVTAISFKPLQVIAKMQYSIFLVHSFIIRIRYGPLRTPTYVTKFRIACETIGDWSVVLIFATIVYITLEMPLIALQKMIMNIDGKKKEMKVKSS